ncbi:sodium/substrate symporter small subunit [Deferrisoma camini]|uniref:sodium/substrate symporter small subunit n=1 Tax=Deferrisoma camini TaxID=1035120 RepID=UPI00046D5638|nr:sodium/substrate symporter small subunit [Deferrisoma camini]
MNSPYRKECWLALTAFVVAAFLTHIYPLYFLFPKLTEMKLFGFPAHYFLTLFLGWVVLMPLYALYIRVSEKIDQQIVETSRPDAEPEVRLAAGGER